MALPSTNPAELPALVKETQRQISRLILVIQEMESMLKKLVREVDSYLLEAQGFLQILNAHSQYVTIQTGQPSREGGGAMGPQQPDAKPDVKQPRSQFTEIPNRDLPAEGPSSVVEQAPGMSLKGTKTKRLDFPAQERSHAAAATLDPEPRARPQSCRATRLLHVCSSPAPWLLHSRCQAPIIPSPTKRTCLGDTASKEEPGSIFQQLLKSICWDSEDNDEEWVRPHSLSSQSTKVLVPQKLEKIWKLKHRTPVLATALSSFTCHAFTCGSDGVKVWSLASQTVENPVPETHLHIQTQGSTVHTCHLTSDSTTLLMAGNSVAGMSVWDLKAPTLHMKSKLPSSGFACQALASSLENNLALGSLSNGIIRIWDLRSGQVVSNLANPSPATKIVVMNQQVWAGSQEGSLQCWDLQNPTEPQKYQFDSQITALSPHPQEDFVLVGLSSGQQWLQPTSGGLRQMVGCKEDTILDLAFSPKGQWWVSVGMDNLLSIYHMPAGTPGLQVARSSSIVCCDVAQNDRLLITGSRNHCTLYQIQY